MNVSEELRLIRSRIEELIREKQSLKDENESLKNRLKELDNQQEDEKNFQEQLKIAKLAARMSPAEKKEMKLMINRYIREIDTCIDLLGNL